MRKKIMAALLSVTMIITLLAPSMWANAPKTVLAGAVTAETPSVGGNWFDAMFDNAQISDSTVTVNAKAGFTAGKVIKSGDSVYTALNGLNGLDNGSANVPDQTRYLGFRVAVPSETKHATVSTGKVFFGIDDEEGIYWDASTVGSESTPITDATVAKTAVMYVPIATGTKDGDWTLGNDVTETFSYEFFSDTTGATSLGTQEITITVNFAEVPTLTGAVTAETPAAGGNWFDDMFDLTTVTANSEYTVTAKDSFTAGKVIKSDDSVYTALNGLNGLDDGPANVPQTRDLGFRVAVPNGTKHATLDGATTGVYFAFDDHIGIYYNATAEDGKKFTPITDATVAKTAVMYVPIATGAKDSDWTLGSSVIKTFNYEFFDANGNTLGKQTITINLVIPEPVAITEVTVTPATANVGKGETQQFEAGVTGTGDFADTVTWEVTGGAVGTTISAGGELSVAADETATTLTVKATSTADTSKSGTATVTVTEPAPPVDEPTVTSVVVTPASVTVATGGTQQFTAVVNGTNNPAQSVTWEVTGGNANTSITDGLLTVAADEAAATLTVKATSTVDGSKSGTATVTVDKNGGAIPPATTYAVTVNGGTASPATAQADETVTIIATVPSGKVFKNWTSSDVTFANANNATTTFTMPAKAVTVTANFEDEVVGSNTVTFTLKADAEGSHTMPTVQPITAIAGETVTVQIPIFFDHFGQIRDCYSLLSIGYDNVDLLNNFDWANGTLTFEMPSKDINILVSYHYSYDHLLDFGLNMENGVIKGPDGYIVGGHVGDIYKSGVWLDMGSQMTFSFVPNSGYKVSKVVFDGVNKGAIKTLDVVFDRNHTLEVTFAKITSGGGGGSTGGSGGGSTTTEPTVTEGASGTDVTVTSPDTTISGTTAEVEIPEIPSSATDSGKPIEVSIEVPDTKITDMISSAEGSSVKIDISIPNSVAFRSNVSIANITVPANIFAAAKENNVDIKISLKNEGGKELTSWTFKASEITNVKNINLAMSQESSSANSAIDKAVGSNASVILNFAHSGSLPATASIKTYVGDYSFASGDSLTLYFFNESTGALEKQSDGIIVDADGYATISISHCSSYVLVKGNVASTPASGSVSNPQTGDSIPVVFMVIASIIGLSTLVVGITLMKRKREI